MAGAGEGAGDHAPTRRLDHIPGLGEASREDAVEGIAGAGRVAWLDARRGNAGERPRRLGDQYSVGAERRHYGAAMQQDKLARYGFRPLIHGAAGETHGFEPV